MPYIKPIRRPYLDKGAAAMTPGELNYKITQLVNDYHRRAGRNYDSINDVVGALESAKLEFYRRIAAPYEDLKITENGDVY